MKTYVRRPNRFLDDDYSLPVVIPRTDDLYRVQEDTVSYTCATKLAIPRRDVSGNRDTLPSPAPSSPLSPSENPFSDPVSKLSLSPPSSPPPRHVTPPSKQHKPAFSFLKRKRSTGTADRRDSPLTEVDINVLKRPPAKKVRMTQMQIDLGGKLSRLCKGCGMDYVPCNAEDAALHKDFHRLNIDGVELGRGFVKEVKTVKRLGQGESIVLVDDKCSIAARRKVRKVLDVVTKDLGAVEITEDQLWGNFRKGRIRKQDSKVEEQGETCFKAFLYCDGDKCVGLCLAERIYTASKVIGPESAESARYLSSTRSSSILTETSTDAVLLGISRIWTSKSHRLKGIASTLLDCARDNFFYGIEVPKKMVAFSQPTESGGLLAERWYEEKTGWHVYECSE